MRKDSLHKATNAIVKAKTKPETIVLEDLNVEGMMKNHKLAGAVADVSFGEFRRQIEYKALWNGIEVLIAPRFYPSSKTCNVCGNVNKDLKLSDRTWTCESCKTELNRDFNAAINLAKLSTVSSTGSYACGQVVYIPGGSKNQTLDFFC